ncbi:MAG: DEAD/DEAH box helicase family protein [Candidatus Caenarcaniphilales bacterium]|nr:DEAD/DEAH box helicase family protein [Candidatus Caenarcaniphilales bacterium]
MKFNEDSRVKIPAILHLMSLGYSYLSLNKNNQNWDKETNIFRDIFEASVRQINSDCKDLDIERLYKDISLILENKDLGKAFYEKLVDQSRIKLIDFEDFNKNTFHVVTELPYQNDDESFRPDITLLINGMPLVFIEVKKPNNKDGIITEHKRIKTRFQNTKLQKFANITQLMVFSNNMEYDDSSPLPIEGAFYATPSYEEPAFNYFREEEQFDLDSLLRKISHQEEVSVLKDTNLISIKDSPEFKTNKDPDSPTNRLLTSLFQRQRLAFLLKYSLAYVQAKIGYEKHIMRYPQIFATKAIESKLEEGKKSGIIWHTQGSGKTALTFYSVKFLTDYFKNKELIPKFYFIVDRIDLANQASNEFESRGLKVHKIESKDKFAREIKATKAIHNDSGKPEITVVNIQKFQDDPDVVKNIDYQVGVQRVFFLDEVHRSYNPKGSFLANLEQADKNSIKIGLTGTPLLGTDYNSRTLFGDYIHKYYYNSSIKDGYTLRLVREEIETAYKMQLKQALEHVEVLQGSTNRKKAYSHRVFVEPMLKYIVEDFEEARIRMNDNSIGGMVICDSSEQAKEMSRIFQEKYERKQKEKDNQVSEAILILHDVGTKEERKDQVDDFKDGKYDLLFVYNMLLTGFDAKRLKKLYLGRVIKAHNLLQALTRVNRTYKDFRYGHVVDFADISKEFDKTNRDYFDELQSELGDEIESYSNLFKTAEEIDNEIEEIKETLFEFDTQNAEVFSQQISQIQDRKEVLQIVKALGNAKSLYNLIKLSGNYELLEKLDFQKLNILSREANNHLALLNTKEALEKDADTTNLLNVALEDVIFTFIKVDESEMVIADQLKNTLQKIREMLGGNFDPKDPAFISLKEELERLFRKKNLNEVTVDEMNNNIKELEQIYTKAKELDRRNQLIKAKYKQDEKYARLHKRLTEKDPLTDKESKLFEALQSLKEEVDEQILQNSNVLTQEKFVERMVQRLVIDKFKNEQLIPLNPQSTKRVTKLVVKEYMDEYKQGFAI